MKATAERIAGSRTALAAAQRLFPVDGVILAYHNVVQSPSDDLGDRSLHLPLDVFKLQLEWLAEAFEITPLTEVLRPRARPDDRPSAAITFDDAYNGAVSLALPELIRRGLPGTVFVCTDWLGGETTWWDGFAGVHGLESRFRAEALDQWAGRRGAVARIATLRGVEFRAMPTDHRIASPAAIADVAARGRITVGAHSKSHPNLTRLTDDELSAELEGSLQATMTRYPTAIPWLAYPYGISDKRVQSAAKAAGFTAALQVAGGPLRRSGWDRYALPRINISRNLSLAGFRIRCAGLR